MSLVYKAN